MFVKKFLYASLLNCINRRLSYVKYYNYRKRNSNDITARVSCQQLKKPFDSKALQNPTTVAFTEPFTIVKVLHLTDRSREKKHNLHGTCSSRAGSISLSITCFSETIECSTKLNRVTWKVCWLVFALIGKSTHIKYSAIHILHFFPPFFPPTLYNVMPVMTCNWFHHFVQKLM